MTINEKRKYAFLVSTNLVQMMYNYSHNNDKRQMLVLEFYASNNMFMPLPSGRWGNAISLALELNDYICAKYLIDNSDSLLINVDEVSSEFEGTYPYSLKDEYLYSLMTYNYDSLLKRLDSLDGIEYSKQYEYLYKNEIAKDDIEKMLGVTKKDKSVDDIKLTLEK